MSRLVSSQTASCAPLVQLSLDMLSLPGGAEALRLWSAEQPHLYLLLLELKSSAEGGDLLEIEACQVRCLCLCWAPARQGHLCGSRICLPVHLALLYLRWACPAAAHLQVGFRHAEIKGRQLLHNGQPIMLKGRF